MRAFLIIFIALTIIGAGFAYWGLSEYQNPRHYNQDSLFVEKGMGGQEIAQAIAKNSNLPKPLFYGLLRLTVHNPIHAGEYDLSDKPSLRTLMARLNNKEIIKRVVAVPEGLTNYQVIVLLKNNPLILNDCPNYKDINEGSLLPETYSFIRGELCSDILARMAGAMDKTLETLWDNRVPNLPYKTKEEALTMASIIEKETGVPSERARVAGVFVNRLRVGMPLQSDPTTIYALTDGTGELGRLLTRADWKTEHPFNTYHIPALPPLPIANPGIESIKAALHPEIHDYYYFVASGDGGHNFGKTLDEHNKNIYIMKNK